MAHPNEELERFYGAFARGEGDAMAACYAPDARFSDPVFTDLRGEEPGAMWRMLTGRAEDLEVQLAEHEGGEERGSAHWLADYTFSTGRRVHNDIRAEFRFENGLIAEHRDSFSFYAWARQALGPPGLALGWTRLLRGRVQREARAGLDEFLGRTPAGLALHERLDGVEHGLHLERLVEAAVRDRLAVQRANPGALTGLPPRSLTVPASAVTCWFSFSRISAARLFTSRDMPPTCVRAWS